MKRLLARLIAAAALISLGAAPAIAQTEYRGRAGVSYDVHDYRGGAPSDPGVIDSSNAPVLRQLFRHSIEFDALGNLGPARYGTWTMGISLDGYYDRATWESPGTPTVDNYYAPDLRNLRGSLSLIPKSRMPSTIHYTGQHYYSLDYEDKNRFVVTTERPYLAVVRKYENRRKDYGARTSVAMGSGLKLSGAYEGASQQVNRVYDFGEDRDIVSLIVPQGQGQNLSDFFVVFSNALPETLTVYMDDTLLIPSMAPEEQLLIVIPAGLHRFELRAPTFNTFRTTRTVNSNLNWVVRYNPPSTPNDRDVSSSAAHFQGVYEPGEKVRNEARLDIEDQSDEVLKSKNKTRVFNNVFVYRPGDRLSFQTTTTYNALTSQSFDLPEEDQNSANHITAADYQLNGRTALTMSHSISTMENRGLKSTINTVEAGAVRKMNDRYDADLTMTLGRLTDNRDFLRKSVGVKTRHKYRGFDLGVARTTFSEQLDVKASTEYNPGRFQTEYDNRVMMDNDLGRWGRAGEFKLSLTYGTRWFADQSGNTLEKRMTANLTITNREWSRLRAFGFVILDDTKATGDGSQAGREVQSVIVKVAGNLKLGDASSATGDFMVVDQQDVDIMRFGIGMSWVWPKVPVRHSLGYQGEEKTYGAGDTERYKTFGQKLSLRIRSIDLSLEHDIVYENVRLGASRYQSIRMNLERGFDI